MTKPCAVVDVVGAKGAAGHLLENKIVLVRRPRRREASKSMGAVLGLNLIEALCRKGNCLIPTCRFERAIFAATAHQRLGQAFGMMNEVHTETALDAEIADVGVRSERGINGDHLSHFGF